MRWTKVMALLPPLPKKHKGWLAGCAVALVLFMIAAVYGDHGLMHVLRMRGEQGDLERMVFDLQQNNERLRQRIQRLQSDDRYIEQLARQRLGLVKKGEIVYRQKHPQPPVR
jgi:cell division protein FtsB